MLFSLRYRSFATKRKIKFVKKSAGLKKGIEKSVPFLSKNTMCQVGKSVVQQQNEAGKNVE